MDGNRQLDDKELQIIAKACFASNQAIIKYQGYICDDLTDAKLVELKKAIKLTLQENPTFDPIIQHENWCRFRISEGWKYVPEIPAHLQDNGKNLVRHDGEKIHTLLKPWGELEEKFQKKDDIFLNTIKIFMKYFNK